MFLHKKIEENKLEHIFVVSVT